LVSVVVAIFALIAANLLVYTLVRQYLEGRLDNQVQQLAQLAPGMLLGPPPPTAATTPRIGRRAQPSQLVGAYIEITDAKGAVIGARFLVGTRDSRKPPSFTSAELHLGKGTTRFIDSTARSGSSAIPYRVRVSSLPNGAVVVAALPAGDFHDTMRRIARIQILASLAIVGMGSILTWVLVGLGLRPLRRIETTAEDIAAGDLSQRVREAGSRTEIGRLGSAFNSMLSEIETAFKEKEASEERLRQFVADASHELKTPLTSIRGYAELLRRGMNDTDRASAAGRIEQESIRLGNLVNDLLLLARLDHGRGLDLEVVNLVGVVLEVAQDARIIERDRVITVDAPGSITILGDRDRIAQVVTNLLSNARGHAPPATAIELRITTQGPHAIVDVVDHGNGISPALRKRVFDRFWRADTSRARASGGAGLGLPIVAAVVGAHGGTCEVRTTAGGGATFRVRLPAWHPAEIADLDDGSGSVEPLAGESV
jgi:two-component system OmpR family sensor kinase